MSAEKFAEFMRGFVAANQLMSRAGKNGCFVEYVCLATAVVDALLRTGLVLRYQLDSRSNDIPLDLVYQADDGKIISERSIYKMALEKSIISSDHFDKLEDLYGRRNKVVHRYIISEITTDQVLQIAMEYQEMIETIREQIRKAEDKQIESGIGMTVSGSQVPEEIRATRDADIQKMADEKHGHPGLAKNLKSTNDSKDGKVQQQGDDL